MTRDRRKSGGLCSWGRPLGLPPGGAARAQRREVCSPPVGGRRGRPAPVLTCAPGETAAAAAKYVCRCSALRSGRFRYYGPRVSRQAALPGPPPHPQPGGPPGPPAGFICGFVGRRAGGVRRTNTGQPGRGAARPNSSSAPGATGKHARVQRLQGRRHRHGETSHANHALTHRAGAAGPHTRSTGKAPCEGGPSPAALGAVEPLKHRVPTVPQPPTWPDSPPGN